MVSSLVEIPTCLVSRWRMFTPRSAARATAQAAPWGTYTDRVSKKSRCSRVRPAASSREARSAACSWIRVAMAVSPSGPWWTQYMAETTAMRAWAVQMLEVAF